MVVRHDGGVRPPLVVLLPWMAAPPAAVQRYCQMLRNLHCDVAVFQPNTLSLWVPSWAAASAHCVLAELESHLRATGPQPLLFAVFSGSAKAVYYQLLSLLAPVYSPAEALAAAHGPQAPAASASAVTATAGPHGMQTCSSDEATLGDTGGGVGGSQAPSKKLEGSSHAANAPEWPMATLQAAVPAPWDHASAYSSSPHTNAKAAQHARRWAAQQREQQVQREQQQERVDPGMQASRVHGHAPSPGDAALPAAQPGCSTRAWLPAGITSKLAVHAQHGVATAWARAQALLWHSQPRASGSSGGGAMGPGGASAGTSTSFTTHYPLCAECFSGQWFDSAPVDFTSTAGARMLEQLLSTPHKGLHAQHGSTLPGPRAVPAPPPPSRCPAATSSRSGPVSWRRSWFSPHLQWYLTGSTSPPGPQGHNHTAPAAPSAHPMPGQWGLQSQPLVATPQHDAQGAPGGVRPPQPMADVPWAGALHVNGPEAHATADTATSPDTVIPTSSLSASSSSSSSSSRRHSEACSRGRGGPTVLPRQVLQRAAEFGAGVCDFVGLEAYERQRGALWAVLAGSALATQGPCLMLYSWDDPVADPYRIQCLAAALRARGVAVLEQAWPSSPHCRHLQAHPDTYQAMVQAWLHLAQRAFAARNQRPQSVVPGASFDPAAMQVHGPQSSWNVTHEQRPHAEALAVHVGDCQHAMNGRLRQEQHHGSLAEQSKESLQLPQQTQGPGKGSGISTAGSFWDSLSQRWDSAQLHPASTTSSAGAESQLLAQLSSKL